MSSLHDLFVRHGTDKGTGHWYGPTYERYVDPSHVEMMLEIGVYEGNSLLAWHEWLPKAEIHGIDRVEEQASIRGFSRIHYHRQDVMDPLEGLPTRWDFIVDDGSHLENEIISVFDRLWPQLVADGWYVVEDLEAPGYHVVGELLEIARGTVREAHLHGELLLIRKC